MIDAWNKLMEIPEAKWIVIGTLLLFIVLIGIYVVTFFRNLAIGGVEEDDDILTGFRRMRDEGQLDDEEYSRLKQAIPNGDQTGSNVPTNTQPPGAEKSEKRFMTLAEAQRQKQEQTEQNGSEESDSGDRVDEHE
jgi:hypothetical protein